MSKKAGNPKIEKKEGNYIDKIIKENCQNLMPFFFRSIFHFNIADAENLPEIKQQKTTEREPDFLRLVHNDSFPDGVVLQLEFEVQDNPKMAKRMLRYISMLHENTDKPVLQFVLYLGTGKAKMSDKIEFGQLKFAFKLFNIEDFSYHDFINSEYPEEVILSVLATHEDISEDQLLELIIGRIVDLKGKRLATEKFLTQLTMLSRLRNLQNKTITILENMSNIEFDLDNDVLYQRGLETGEERGVAKGLEKGLEKGEIKKSISGIWNMTKSELKPEAIAQFLDLEVVFVKKIQKQLSLIPKMIVALKKGEKETAKIAKDLKVHPLLVDVIQDDLKAKKKKK
jgi:predicted transposase/invertase (TIGR01784 family)